MGSQNIDIGNDAIIGDSSTIRIGDITQNRTFIAGIRGVVVDGSPVVVGAGGQPGVVASSQQFKDDIHPMERASEAIYGLKPIRFRYKPEIDAAGTAQFGLVAEDVEKVNPDLVVRDKEGKPYSVRYDQVNAMLLNEFLKEHRKVEQQGQKIQEQDAIIAQLKSGMETLTATVREQAAQIQKVSAQLEASKSAPQVADSNY
jgi:hypothetical protein